LRVDAIDVDPAALLDSRIAVDDLENIPTLALVAYRAGGWRRVGLVDTRSLRFVGALSNRVLDRIPGVRGLKEPSARTAEPTTLVVGELVAAVGLDPRLGLVLQGALDALTKSGD